MTHSTSQHPHSFQNHTPYHNAGHPDYFHGEKSLMPLPLIAFFTVFFGGILFANFKWSDEVFWLGYQTENSLRQFEAGDLSVSAFFLFFLKNRAPLWILPAIASCLHKRKSLILALFAAWLGFASGFFVTTSIRRFGIFSFPLLFAMLFPQIIFYILSFGLLLKADGPAHTSFSKDAKGLTSPVPFSHSYAHQTDCMVFSGNTSHTMLPGIFVSLILYFAGVLSEYALNPWFLEFAGRLL